MESDLGGARSTGCLGAKLLRSSRCGRGEARGSAIVVRVVSTNLVSMQTLRETGKYKKIKKKKWVQ